MLAVVNWKSYICINLLFLDLADMYNYIKMVLAQHWVHFTFMPPFMSEKSTFSLSFPIVFSYITEEISKLPLKIVFGLIYG